MGRRWTFEAEKVAPDPVVESKVDNDVTLTTSTSADEGPRRFRLLENLALQRVVDSITQDSSDVRWTITGVLTEFEGENWLLLATVLRAPSNISATSQP